MLTHTAQKAYTVLAAVNPAVEFDSSCVLADDRHQCGIFSSVSRQFSMAALNGRPCACRLQYTGLSTRLVPPTLLTGGNGSVKTVLETDMTTHAISAPALSVFSFESSYQVRVIIKCNEPWFCLRDVCAVLDIQNNSQLSKQLDTKGISKTYTPTNGGKQQLIYVNEPNLYRVIFRSNKPEARRFQDWVFNEVLPEIRKTGEYSVQKTITPEQQKAIRMLVSDRVRSLRTNKPRENYAYFYRSLKIHFGVSKYNQLPYNKFDEAVCFIRSLSPAESDHGITLTTEDALILHTLLCILPRLIDSGDKYNDAQILLPSLMQLKEKCSSAFNNLMIKGAL